MPMMLRSVVAQRMRAQQRRASHCPRRHASARRFLLSCQPLPAATSLPVQQHATRRARRMRLPSLARDTFLFADGAARYDNDFELRCCA